jgi:predicted GIY-YIG superfamily endonuclease
MVNIYVLKLEKRKYYVGKTKRLNQRIKDHFKSNGAEWTKIYNPIQVVEELKNVDDSMENTITREYMRKYGIENVRGGSYCSVMLPDFQKQALEKEFCGDENKCFRCSKKGHFANECDKKDYSSSSSSNSYSHPVLDEPQRKKTKITDDKCFRCGRYGHWETNCYAKTVINETKKSSSKNDDSCYKCGRDSHWANNCYAKYHIDGTYIC